MLIVDRKPAESVVWAWFNPKQLLWVRVYKMNVSLGSPRRWCLMRGSKGTGGYQIKYFDSYDQLLDSLHGHEVDALAEHLERQGIPAMQVLAAISRKEEDLR